MPNYVVNRIKIVANKEDKSKVLNTIKGKNGIVDFEKIIPMPENIYRGDLGKEEEKKYGENNWYDWSIKNWGTKWNAFEPVIDGNYVFFLTAWSFPEPVIRKLSEMFPDVYFVWEYADEDIGNNYDRKVYEKGQAEDLAIEHAEFFCENLWEFYGIAKEGKEDE